jgi:hypothetical protein
MTKSVFKCELCNKTFKKEVNYNKHKFTKLHLDNIKNICIEPLKEDKKVSSFDYDPYLEDEDLQKLKNMNIGEGIDILFNNDNIIKCQFNFSSNGSHQVEENKGNFKGELADEDRERLKSYVINDKQKQIIVFLVKHQYHKDIYNKWFKILQKLDLEVLKGLPYHILNCQPLTIDFKKKSLGIVKKYKTLLKSKRDAGLKLVNNIDINQIILLLDI